MRLIVVFVGLALTAAIGSLLTALGLSLNYAVAAACYLAGVLLLYAGRALDDWFLNVNVLYVFGGMVLAAAPGWLAVAWGESGYRQNGFLRYLVGAAIEVILLIVTALAVTAVYELIASGRRARQRRRIAAEQGWRYEEADPTLVSQMGERLHYVVGSLSIPVDPKVEPGTQAHAVLRGQSNGVGFAAFDFYRPRRLVPPDRATAVIVPLPGDVPLFTSMDVIRLYDRHENGDIIADPVLARLVTTADVATLTFKGLRSWWFDGRVLVAISGNPHRSASDKQLHADIIALTYLARLLNWDAISRHRPTVQTG